jgi:hypothetical protein
MTKARFGQWRVLILLIFMTLLAPSQSLALPTPDVVVGIANTLPLIVGALATGISAVLFWLRRTFGSRRADFVSGAACGLLAALIVSWAFGGLDWDSGRREQAVQELGIYLRCDFEAHDVVERRRLSSSERAEAWRAYGHFRTISIDSVASQLSKQPDAALLATYGMGIEYQSGIPVVEVDGNLRFFEFVRRSELAARLDQLKVKDLYLVDFAPYRMKPEFFPELTPLFAKFARVYLLNDEIPKSFRLVREAAGQVRSVDLETRVFRWPVRDEPWLMDQRRVAFPGIVNLLSDQEAAKYLEDDRVYIVAIYNSFLRSRSIYVSYYLRRLLDGINPARRIVIDMYSENISGHLNDVARLLDGKPFLVVGLTKYDYVYNGVDFAFELWERLRHDPTRFQLVGFSVRLPEVVATYWFERKQ